MAYRAALLIIVVACMLSVTVSALDPDSDPAQPYAVQLLLAHIQRTVAQCEESELMVATAKGCAGKGISLLSEATTKEDNSTRIVEFVDCMEPFKKLLEDCSVASARADDLAALDVAKSLSKNEGALYGEIVDKFKAAMNDRPDDCPEDDEHRIQTLYADCWDELGISSVVEQFTGDDVHNAFAIFENLCSYASGMRTCVNRVKAASIGATCESYYVTLTDVYLEAFQKVEAESENPDIISECFAFRTA